MRIASMVTAVDLHACGEPGRVIVGGVLDVPGKTMFEKMLYLSREADDLRKRMLREPRGYPAANCNLILPPTRPEADAGFVIYTIGLGAGAAIENMIHRRPRGRRRIAQPGPEAHAIAHFQRRQPREIKQCRKKIHRLDQR